jgi:uncharacterized membrane protein
MSELPRGAKLLAAGFAASGTLHILKPEVYEPLMPPQLPAQREIIIWSGAAEMLCAAGLLLPQTRRLAGLASAVLLVGVFPGNLKMADDARKSDNAAFKAAAYARLPLQLPMIRAALKASRRGQ